MDEARLQRIEEGLAKLTREFQEHRHTGLDSKVIDLRAQIVNQGPITPADNTSIDEIYGVEEEDVIENSRTRIGEIEYALQVFGILS